MFGDKAPNFFELTPCQSMINAYFDHTEAKRKVRKMEQETAVTVVQILSVLWVIALGLSIANQTGGRRRRKR